MIHGFLQCIYGSTIDLHDKSIKAENENDPIELDHMSIHFATASNAAV